MLTTAEVTACLVTRGDQPEMMQRILESLIFDDVVVWDNSKGDDRKVAGRYAATALATRPVVYFQDDDVYVPPMTQAQLVKSYKPGVCVANYGHGDTPDGYDDMPLVHAGAIVDKGLCREAIQRYTQAYPIDDGFFYETDFIVGILYPKFEHVHLPHEIILPIAQHPSRMCNQPWQRDLKLRITERARAIRDGRPITDREPWHEEVAA